MHVQTKPNADGYQSERKYATGEVIKAEIPFPVEMKVSSLFS